MSTVVQPPERAAASSDDATPEASKSAGPHADASALQDRVPGWLQAPRVLAAFTLVLGVVYLLLSYYPLWHTDLWGHLAYGRWIWEHGRLPHTEPLMPLSAGVPMIDTAWLSQFGGFLLYSQFGAAGLQAAYAASITVCGALLCYAVFRRCGNPWATLLGLVTFLGVNHQQLLIVRPQLIGLICFVALFTLLTGKRRKYEWLAVGLLFVLWANTHGSFFVGFGLLGCFTLGRAVDVWRKTRRIGAIFLDRATRRCFVLTEVAALAALVNPYGIGLYGEVLAISQNANLQNLVEWDPLTLRMKQGKAAAAAALGLFFAYRLSPRRVSSTEVLLLVGLGLAALHSSRMLVWWAPLAAYYLSIHTAAALRRYWNYHPSPSPRNGRWSVVTAGLIWIFFAYTPFGMDLIHGGSADAAERDQEAREAMSKSTPVAAVDYLRRNPPTGQIYNTYEWGDYILWDGPPDVQVFVASHAHLVPREVWQDYLVIATLSPGWEQKLDRYGVNTVIVDKSGKAALIAQLKNNTDTWEVGYEDGRSIVLNRKEPI